MVCFDFLLSISLLCIFMFLLCGYHSAYIKHLIVIKVYFKLITSQLWSHMGLAWCWGRCGTWVYGTGMGPRMANSGWLGGQSHGGWPEGLAWRFGMWMLAWKLEIQGWPGSQGCGGRPGTWIHRDGPGAWVHRSWFSTGVHRDVPWPRICWNMGQQGPVSRVVLQGLMAWSPFMSTSLVRQLSGISLVLG